MSNPCPRLLLYFSIFATLHRALNFASIFGFAGRGTDGFFLFLHRISSLSDSIYSMAANIVRIKRLNAQASHVKMMNQKRISPRRKLQKWMAKHSEITNELMGQIPESIFTPERNTYSPPDPDAILLKTRKDGRPLMYKPTEKQLKAEYYRSQGKSKAKSMRLAGYKTKKNQASVFSPSLSEYMHYRMMGELKRNGLTEAKMAEKMKEWLEAKTTTVTKDGELIENPDYNAQIKAYDRINEIAKFSGPTGPTGATGKRKMTIEEWTFGADSSTAEAPTEEEYQDQQVEEIS